MVDPMDTEEPAPTNTGKGLSKPWKPLTFDEIAEAWGVSREAVRRTHERALKKLRRALRLDPHVRDWLKEQGFDPSEITDADSNH
tara:strand:- start:352 stop:606 length:255 start_codon:yes stop_codon:yes gene_type:complete